MGEQIKRLLLLVVDKDDDVGTKAGISSPIIGREANLSAATKLILADPEDADANAMFAAVKLYDELSKKGNSQIEIATITGLSKGGMDADLKVANELENVLERYKAEECVIVSDGPLDQSLMAVITSRIKVSSLRYVVVKQSPSLEQGWLLLARYIRTAFSDPYYSKMVLGIPGALILTSGILSLFNLFNVPLLLTIIGITLLVRGTRADVALAKSLRRAYGLLNSPLAAQIRMFTTLSSLILLLLSINSGIGYAAKHVAENMQLAPSFAEDPMFWVSRLGLLIGLFLAGSLDIMLIAIMLTVAFNIFYYIVMRSLKLWRMVQAALSSVIIWAVLKTASEFLITGKMYYLIQLLLTAVLGMVVLITSFMLIRLVRKRMRERFRKP